MSAKTSALSSLNETTVAPLDIVPVVDVSDTTMAASGTNKKITIEDLAAAVAPAGAGSGGYGTHINATASPYNMSTAGSASANTTALKAAVQAAVTAGKGVFIPAGIYMVNPGCLTPTLGSAAVGLEVVGEGMWKSVLRMATQASPGYFFDNLANANTLAFANYRDIGFEGGPTETGTQRATINPNHNGFRLVGQTDQSFRFFRCRFATMFTVFHTYGNNNADITLFLDCRWRHIEGNGWLLDNMQSVNMNVVDSSLEFIWGDLVHVVDTQVNSGAGGISFMGGNIIIQRDGSDVGCGVKIDNFISSIVNFNNIRFEVRNDSMLVDGTANNGPAMVNFNGCTIYTTFGSGDNLLVDIHNDQSVQFSHCNWETNGAEQSYRVRGSGFLGFDYCKVRSNLQSKITIDSPGTGASNGTALATHCHVRYANGTRMNFDI